MFAEPMYWKKMLYSLNWAQIKRDRNSWNLRSLYWMCEKFFFAFSRWHKQPQWIANHHIQEFNTITVLVNWAVTQRSIGCFINEYMNQMRRLRIPYWSYIKTAAGLILFLKSLITFFVVYRAIDIHCFERKMFQRCILWLSPFESIIDWSAQPVWNIFTNECACKNNPSLVEACDCTMISCYVHSKRNALDVF